MCEDVKFSGTRIGRKNTSKISGTKICMPSRVSIDPGSKSNSYNQETGSKFTNVIKWIYRVLALPSVQGA